MMERDLDQRLREHGERMLALTDPVAAEEARRGASDDQVSGAVISYRGVPTGSVTAGRGRLVAIAACVLVVFGAAVIVAANGRQDAPSPSRGPSASTSVRSDSTVPPTAVPALADDSFYDRAKSLGTAAYLQPSPAEEADLLMAAELVTWECLRDGGSDLASPTEAEHRAYLRAAEESWERATAAFTDEGVNRLPTEGFWWYRNRWPQERQAAEGTLEARLLVDGCNKVAPERFDALQPTYLSMQETIEDSEFAGFALSPAVLPGFATTYRRFVACVGVKDPDELDRRVVELARADEPTAEELALADDFARCRNETDYSAAYRAELRPVLKRFVRQYDDELNAIVQERALALEEAHSVLLANHMQPFTA